MKILAIIVTYNAMPWADQCLGSLEASQTACDIMVIDNASTDETVRHIRQHHPGVTLVENKRNLGFGKANNIGMRRALEQGYEAVLLLNQDAWIAGDTLGRLARASRQHPDYGILSPVHLTARGDEPERGFSTYSGISDLSRQPEADVVSVPFIDAAIWFLPVSALRRIGLFAPLFYHYGEDKDMANRMRYHHLRTGFLPRVYGCHDRADRPQTRFGFFRAERTYHLSEYANINYTLPRAFALGVLALVKKAAVRLAHGQWRDGATYLGMAAALTGRTRQVIVTRNTSKRPKLERYT